MPRIVRTVRGDIRPDELGPCDAHAHLFLTTPLQPGDEFADVALAIEDARLLAATALPHWLNSQPTPTTQLPRRLSPISRVHNVWRQDS